MRYVERVPGSEASTSIHTEFRARYRTRDNNEQFTRTGTLARVEREIADIRLTSKITDVVFEKRTTKTIRSDWSATP